MGKSFYAFKNGILPLSKKHGTKTDSGDQQPDTPRVLEEAKFRGFLEQIKEEQRALDMNLFEKNFDYKAPDKMAQVLFDSRSNGDYHKEATCLEHFFFLETKLKRCPKKRKH